jgi:hypothetical protein
MTIVTKPTTNRPYRFQLPRKAVKSDCPDCGPKHRKTLSRYVDTKTGDPLPDEYGRCDRESNCGYHLSPYHKGSSGVSYADTLYEAGQLPPIPKSWFRMGGKQKRNSVSRQGFKECLIEMERATPEQAERVAAFIFDRKPERVVVAQPIHCIPSEMFTASLGHYERNQLARLLIQHLGDSVASDLLQRFQVGTSSRWPGACVFWYIDEQDRIRGGQIKLFGHDFHTAKYVDKLGETRSKTSWVHAAYARRLDEQQHPYPDWLTAYLEQHEFSPCLFGLPQLKTAPADKPIAIVEAPKTAILCSHYLPGFIWLAVGALSYLNVQRLAPVKQRKVVLFPDLSKDGTAFARWSRVAAELRAQGFRIDVSDFLEQHASEGDKAQGLDLADYLLRPAEQSLRIVTTLAEWVPGTILRPDESQIERLEIDSDDDYPPEWDTPTPQIRAFAGQSVESFPNAPLAFDTSEQARRIYGAVIPPEEEAPPVLVPSSRRSDYARILGIIPNELPLYQLQRNH